MKLRCTWTTILLTIAAILITTTAAQAAIYIHIESVPGDSTAQDHEGWIDVTSFGIGVDVVISEGQIIGEPYLTDLLVKRTTSDISPTIVEFTILGTIIPTVQLDLTRQTADGSEHTYATWTLHDVLVSSYSTSGASESQPSETFSLNYEEIKFEYMELDPLVGDILGTVVFEWIPGTDPVLASTGVVDNFAFATGDLIVPEPTSLALLFAGMTLTLRRHARRN